MSEVEAEVITSDKDDNSLPSNAYFNTLGLSQVTSDGKDSDDSSRLIVTTGAPVGRMVDSTQADDRKLIRLVKERRLLYARNNMPVASFYAQVKTLWSEVADEMGWTVPEVRRKWSHVRNSYSRHLRNEMHGARTGKGRVVSRWYLADELNFLREHMATDTRPSPYSHYRNSPTMVNVKMEENSNPELIEIKPFVSSPWFALPDKMDSQDYNEENDSNSNFGPDENCSFFQFFRGIYNDYKDLSAKKQRMFKRQCLNLLHELLDEEEDSRVPASLTVRDDVINLSYAKSDSEVISDEK